MCATFSSAGKNKEASTKGKSMNEVGNASLRTEKGCGSYTKVKTFA